MLRWGSRKGGVHLAVFVARWRAGQFAWPSFGFCFRFGTIAAKSCCFLARSWVLGADGTRFLGGCVPFP
uniref:Putative secreted protein n=1 Tax=Anopheles darlingi TaxID=43151 RepID=A0A2M4D6D6_ANODA